LILHSPPFTAVDAILSYSHLSIQNDTLTTFFPYFTERARVGQLLTASPLSMGLLTPKPPAWHPANDAVRASSAEAGKACTGWDGGLLNISLGYAYRMAQDLGLATVTGFGTPDEVHQTMKIWRETAHDAGLQKRKEYERKVIKILENGGSKDYSWASP